ncbi:ABC transporter ATP-binding protein [Thermostichus vulcanus]|uniref:ABC transporter ATP-binding protein n=1 Tax=Thermostichus vulcanus str. 'Rupite' TaxID=2813851 RepID=A0ABT0CF54_THEVL|nr:ABC transporter ATP-binding protein [Thermostichus vulcanus]MCJ2543985.1 ABC transporter ATP-binding protein [Thermostichus vulcanus str. 'Rupite']
MTRLRRLLQAFQILTEAAGKWTWVWLGLLLWQGLLPVGTVYLTKTLVDGLVVALPLGTQGISLLIWPVTGMASLLLLGELGQSALGWVRAYQAERVRDYISLLIHRQSTRLDLAFYETPNYHDQLHQARGEASQRSLALLESWGQLFQNGMSFLSMFVVLSTYALWLPLLLLIGTLPAFYVLLVFNRQHYRWWKETTPERRWTEYYDLMLTQKVVAAEVRIFDLGEHFTTIYQSIRKTLRQQRLRLLRNQSLGRLGASALGLGVSGAAMAWMFWRSLQGLASLGDLALFYQAFNRGQTLMRSLLGSLSEIHQSGLFLENLFTFLQLEPQLQDPKSPKPMPSKLERGIEVEGVYFRYPGSQSWALENLDLFLPAGKFTAIIGDNGAGKSTLIKLLCRFYQPERGRILLDQSKLEEFSVEELRSMITVLFQWPVNYQATVTENIAMGDLKSPIEETRVRAAAVMAGAEETINRLHQRYDTLLGTAFVKGTDLSGGEWQRIALARAFYRQAPIILLDEPTSALDPWAELEWVSRFRKVSEGKTSLLITHRLNLARHADLIYVMRNGQIVESGSHNELLASSGSYAHSWKAQLQQQPIAI